jgi:hypothetical protein
VRNSRTTAGAGRCGPAVRFLSGGPLLSLSVDGSQPGDTVELSGPGSVTVYSTARSVFPLRSLEIVRNGELVAVEEAHGRRELSLSESLRVDGSTWFAARTFGTDNQLDVWGRKVFAHTSPVYVAWWAVGHGRSGRAPLHPHVRRGRP